MRMFLILLVLLVPSAAYAQTNECAYGPFADTRLFADTEVKSDSETSDEDGEQEEEDDDEEPDCD